MNDLLKPRKEQDLFEGCVISVAAVRNKNLFMLSILLIIITKLLVITN